MPKFDRRKLHIVYLISSLANEGPTRVLLNILRHIDRSLFEVTVITLVAEKPSSLYREFSELGISLHLQPGKFGQTDSGIIRRARFLRMFVRDCEADIVHGHCPRSLIYLMFLRGVAHTAYTAHIFPGVQTIALYGALKGRIVASMCNLFIRFVKKPIACSDSVALEFRENIGLDVEAVNNGIEDISTETLRNSRSQLRSQLGLSPDLKYFIFLGRLSPEKRPLELVRMFVESNIPGAGLVILGEGPLESDILDLSKNSNVSIEGFKKDVAPYLHACDFYVSSSRTEGLANSLLEALSAGMPVLLSNIPSHRQVIERAGSFIGSIFDPDTEGEFSDKVRQILDSDISVIRTNARAEFMNRYTAHGMAKGYERIYQKIGSVK